MSIQEKNHQFKEVKFINCGLIARLLLVRMPLYLSYANSHTQFHNLPQPYACSRLTNFIKRASNSEISDTLSFLLHKQNPYTGP